MALGSKYFSEANKFLSGAVGNVPANMVANPLEAGAGLATGVAKGVVDFPVYGAALAGTIMGQGKNAVIPALNQYEDFWMNTARGIAGVDKSNLEKNQAVVGGVNVGSVFGPGALGKIPAVGAIKAGGLGGTALVGGLVKSAENSAVNAVANAPGVANIVDTLISGSAKSQNLLGSGINTATDLLANSPFKPVSELGKNLKKASTEKNAVVEMAALSINPKSASEIIQRESPTFFNQVTGQLQKNTQRPIIASNIRDLGKELFLNEKNLQAKDLVPKIESLIKNTGLKEEEFTLAKNQILMGYKEAQAVADPKTAQNLFDTFVSQVKKSTDPTQFKDEVVNKFKLVNESKHLKYLEDLADPSIPNDSAKVMFGDELFKNLKTIESLDPTGDLGILPAVKDAYNKNIVSNLGTFLMFGRKEPAIGDTFQALMSFSGASNKLSMRHGIDVAEESANWLPSILNAPKYIADNREMFKNAFYDKYGVLTDAFSTSLGKSAVVSNAVSAGAQNILKMQPSEMVTLLKRGTDFLMDAGFGVQRGAREMLINSLVIPQAMAKAKTLGFAEDTLAYNRAVLNMSEELMRSMGFIPERFQKFVKADGKMQEVTTLGTGLKEALGEKLGESGSSSAQFLMSWVELAQRGFLQNYNVIGDVVTKVARGGKITSADRGAFANAVLDQALSGLFFGARGVRVPFMMTEWADSQYNPDINPQSVGQKITNQALSYIESLDPDVRDVILEGFVTKSITSMPMSRGLTIPLSPVPVGNEIIQGIAQKHISTILEAAKRSLDSGNPGDFLNILGKLASNNELNRETQGKISEAPVNAKGEPLTFSLEEGTMFEQGGSAAGGITGLMQNQPLSANPPPELKPLQEVEQIGIKIKQKYERMTIEQFLTKRNINGLIEDISLIQGTDRQERALKAVFDSKLVPPKNSSYRQLESVKNTLSNQSPEEIKKRTRFMSRKDLVEALSYAIVYEDEKILPIVFQASNGPKTKQEFNSFIEEASNSRITKELTRLKEAYQEIFGADTEDQEEEED